MIARPASTQPIPRTRSVPNRSPKTTADDSAPTTGTSNANGATAAAA
jgi:hypothetical protein